MSALAWTPTRDALDAALLGATGQDLASGQALRAQLVALGTRYDARFAASGVDAAKTDWTTLATAAWEQADEACQYVESVANAPDPPGPALTFDPYSSAAIVARCNAAVALTSVAALKTMLAAQRDAVAAFYSGTVATAAYSVVVTTTRITSEARRPPPVNVYALKYDEIVALDEAKQLPFDRWKAAVRLPWPEQVRLRAEAERALAAFNATAPRTTTETVVSDDSVLTIEGELFVLLAGVTEFIAAIGYP